MNAIYMWDRLHHYYSGTAFMWLMDDFGNAVCPGYYYFPGDTFWEM